MTTNKILKSYC